MKQKDKELLFKDLCARLPYGVIVKYKSQEGEGDVQLGCGNIGYVLQLGNGWWKECKPYLRPMSSMTDEEILELYKISYDTWYCDSLYYKNEEFISFRDSIQNNALCLKSSVWMSDINKVIDWLNSQHFDYRGLIKKGLALETPKGMYK